MYRYNVLYLRQWFLVPRWMAKLSSMSVGWLLRSGAPQEGAIGATLEIQRAQQLELLEQQVLLNRARDVRRQVGIVILRQLYTMKCEHTFTGLYLLI